MDYFIITVVTLAGLIFHAWLFVRFRRWADRDLAFTPSWSAARTTASVSTPASAAGRKPAFGSSIRISISGENLVHESL